MPEAEAKCIGAHCGNSTRTEKLSRSSVLVHNLLLGHSRLGPFLAKMAEETIDLFQQAVRNMLAALQMPDVDENELHDLTLRIGYAGKLGEPIELQSLN
jgi:hypothetical protein